MYNIKFLCLIFIYYINDSIVVCFCVIIGIFLYIIWNVLDILNYNWCVDKLLIFGYFIFLLVFKVLEVIVFLKIIKLWNFDE